MRTAYNPKRPTGTTPEALFDQWVWDLLQRKFANSPTVRVNDLGRTISFDAEPGVIASNPILCVVTTLYGTDQLPGHDFIGVKKWNPAANDGDGDVVGAEFMCAKCITGRMPSTETIDGIVIVYDEYSDNERHATFLGSDEERQVLHARYIPFVDGQPPDQCYIIVSKTQNGTGVLDDAGTQINFIEIQPTRYWCYAAVQDV